VPMLFSVQPQPRSSGILVGSMMERLGGLVLSGA
jgi:hypothetical protein